MSKNLMSVIAKELGVELGEEFKIKGITLYKYRIKNDKFEVCSCDDKWEPSTLSISLLGNIEIIKIPYKPKYSEQYWTYTGRAWNVTNTLWEDRAIDCIRKHCGIVFRTETEAFATLPAKYKELTGKEWKENG